MPKPHLLVVIFGMYLVSNISIKHQNKQHVQQSTRLYGLALNEHIAKIAKL